MEVTCGLTARLNERFPSASDLQKELSQQCAGGWCRTGTSAVTGNTAVCRKTCAEAWLNMQACKAEFWSPEPVWKVKHRTIILALETKISVSLDLGSWIVLPNQWDLWLVRNLSQIKVSKVGEEWYRKPSTSGLHIHVHIHIRAHKYIHIHHIIFTHAHTHTYKSIPSSLQICSLFEEQNTCACYTIIFVAWPRCTQVSHNTCIHYAYFQKIKEQKKSTYAVLLRFYSHFTQMQAAYNRWESSQNPRREMGLHIFVCVSSSSACVNSEPTIRAIIELVTLLPATLASCTNRLCRADRSASRCPFKVPLTPSLPSSTTFSQRLFPALSSFCRNSYGSCLQPSFTSFCFFGQITSLCFYQSPL